MAPTKNDPTGRSDHDASTRGKTVINFKKPRSLPNRIISQISTLVSNRGSDLLNCKPSPSVAVGRGIPEPHAAHALPYSSVSGIAAVQQAELFPCDFERVLDWISICTSSAPTTETPTASSCADSPCSPSRQLTGEADERGLRSPLEDLETSDTEAGENNPLPVDFSDCESLSPAESPYPAVMAPIDTYDGNDHVRHDGEDMLEYFKREPDTPFSQWSETEEFENNDGSGGTEHSNEEW